MKTLRKMAALVLSSFAYAIYVVDICVTGVINYAIGQIAVAIAFAAELCEKNVGVETIKDMEEVTNKILKKFGSKKTLKEIF